MATQNIGVHNTPILPWLVWLSGLSAGLWTERSPVRSPVEAHAWVAGQIPLGGVWEANDWYLDCYLSLRSMFLSSFIQDFIYLFLVRGEGKQRGRETSMCGCLPRAPNWGPGPQPRHASWLGIEPGTLWFTGPHSIRRATPARVCQVFLNKEIIWSDLWLGKVKMSAVLPTSETAEGHISIH